jgi:hypothetical protein
LRLVLLLISRKVHCFDGNRDILVVDAAAVVVPVDQRETVDCLDHSLLKVIEGEDAYRHPEGR